MSEGEKKCPFCAETIKAEAIRCRHCQADLSVGTGPSAKRMNLATKIFLWVVLTPAAGLLGVIAIGALSESSRNDATQISAGPKANQQIWLDSSAFGCMTKTDLDQALDHYARGEYTVWAEITGTKYCFHQNDVSSDVAWTVMQVRGDLMQIGLKRASEYQKDPKLGQFDYWTLTKWAVLSAPPVLTASQGASTAPKAAITIDSKSKPAKASVPVRSTADPLGHAVRSLDIGSVVQVYEFKSGMVRISKKGKSPEWILPEALDW